MNGNVATTDAAPRVVVDGVLFSPRQLDDLCEESRALRDDDLAERIAGESVILDLREAHDESDFMARLLKRFGNRTQIGFERMRRPPAHGLKGKALEAVRRVLWSLMRGPHDWAAFQQNAVNEQTIRALALEVRLRRREGAALRARLEALERAVEPAGTRGGTMTGDGTS